MEGVYHKSIHSGKWLLINILTQKALSLVTFFVMARLLLPEDYGVITVVLLVVGIINQLTTFPFGDAITQRQGDVEAYLDPVWTLDLLRTGALAIGFFFAGGLIANFFHVPSHAIGMIQFAGIFLVIPALANIRQLYFFKQLDFRKVFVRDVVSQIAYATTAIVYAIYIQPSPWALFYGYCALYLTGMIASYLLAPARPAISFRFRPLKTLVPFTKWVYGQDFLDLFLAQIDKLVVARLLEPALLGIYSRAKDLSSMTTSILTSIISKVGFPAFSLLQDRMDKIKEGFLKSVDVLLMAALPFAIIMLLEGGAIVRMLLGVPWLPLVVPLKIFAFGNVFLSFVRVVIPVFSAIGRPDINTKLNALQAILSVPLMVVGYYFFGFRGLASAVVITWIVMLSVVILKARPILRISTQEIAPGFVSGTVASVGVFIVDLLFRLTLPGDLSALLVLLKLAVLSATYLGLLFWTSTRFTTGPLQTLISVSRVIVSKNVTASASATTD